MTTSNELLADLQWRGLIHQCSDLEALNRLLSEQRVTLYCGFDPTAESLHVGNLIPLISLARFQRAGHRALALVGGATGLIGDPSGKASERALQSQAEVNERTDAIGRQLLDVLHRCAGEPCQLVNNIDWTQDMSLLTFLRDVGKHFSVNAMIQRDSVRSRLDREGEGISFTEFSYMLLQANDFLALHEQHGCLLQLGGSDQWGNMVSGTDLIRRKHNRQALALTFPLLTNREGQKFGKSVNGAVWLNAHKTSPWEFFQFWLNTEDSEVVKLLKLFTFVARADIEELERSVQNEPHLRKAQRRLAQEMTTLIHGAESTEQVERANEVLFGKGDVRSLSLTTLRSLAQSLGCLPVAPHPAHALNSLLVKTGLAPSMTQANELLRSGSVSLNNERQAANVLLEAESVWLHGEFVLLKKGKKHFALVRKQPPGGSPSETAQKSS